MTVGGLSYVEEEIAYRLAGRAAVGSVPRTRRPLALATHRGAVGIGQVGGVADAFCAERLPTVALALEQAAVGRSR